MKNYNFAANMSPERFIALSQEQASLEAKEEAGTLTDDESIRLEEIESELDQADDYADKVMHNNSRFDVEEAFR